MKRGWFREMRNLMIGLANRTNLKRVRVRKSRWAERGNYLSMAIMASGSWYVSKLSMRRNVRMTLCGNGSSLIDGSPATDWWPADGEFVTSHWCADTQVRVGRGENR